MVFVYPTSGSPEQSIYVLLVGSEDALGLVELFGSSVCLVVKVG
jgi:hypothetical protein